MRGFDFFFLPLLERIRFCLIGFDGLDFSDGDSRTVSMDESGDTMYRLDVEVLLGVMAGEVMEVVSKTGNDPLSSSADFDSVA